MTEAAASSPHSPSLRSRHQMLLASLDGLLFQPGGWFTIDAGNNKVGPVDSRRAGLEAVATDSAARSVVGYLAVGVVAADVDADDLEGQAIAEHLANWATAQGRWHLVRPSGGGRGRFHVYCVPGDDVDQLATLIEDLRETYGLSSAALELRGRKGGSRTLRPLTAPHRRTGASPAPFGTAGELAAAVADLKDLLPPSRRRQKPATAGTSTRRPASARRRRALRATRRLVASHGSVPLTPVPIRRTELPDPWQAYLDGGPTPRISGFDQTRSAIEQACTSVLLRAGMSVDEAWHAIQTASGDAMGRTRTRGRRWWVKYSWNRAVASDTTFRTALPAAAPEPERRHSAATTSQETWRAVEAARASLTASQWQLGHRRRPGTLLVAHLLLDRMLRADQLTVPCPIRDLECDSGLSRTTVINALRWLHGVLGRRLENYDHTLRDVTSYEFELDAKFSAVAAQSAALSLHGPPSVTPPQPERGRWSTLPSPAHSLWRQLPPTTPAPGHPNAHAQTLQDLAEAAGMTHGAGVPLSTRQRRTVQAHLEELEQAGLAVYDERAGQWTRSDHASPSQVRRAAAVFQTRLARIAVEREEWRSSGGGEWVRGRRAAARKARARQRSWWHELDAAEKAQRVAAKRAEFGGLSQYEQARRKSAIAGRRRLAGEPSERSRHAGWCREFTVAEQADRSALYQWRFQNLSTGEQQDRIAYLAAHRERWSLPEGWSTSAPAWARSPEAAAA